MWQVMLLKLGINLVTKYIESSDTKQDDKILGIVKDGAKYLSQNENNTLSTSTAISILESDMCDWGE